MVKDHGIISLDNVGRVVEFVKKINKKLLSKLLVSQSAVLYLKIIK